MSEWRWISTALMHAVHERQLADHGGPPGIRDPGLVESALARPHNLATYGDPDAADLAAAYAFGIVRNHGFVDGDKRTAWILVRVFLIDNGYELRFDPVDAVVTVESLAAGTLDECGFAAWLRERLVPSR